MDLISSPSLAEIFTIVGSVAFVMNLILRDTLNTPLALAFLNATSVVLKNTEVVWRPALKFSLMVIKPIVKALLHVFAFAFNAVIPILATLKDAGMNVTTALSNFANEFSDFGKSLYVVGRGLTNAFVYSVKGLSMIIKSFEDVLAFLPRMVFQAHQITLEELSTMMIPFFVVGSVLLLARWSLSKPAPQQFPVPLRRSSRLERKRAMMSCGDLSALSASCKKSSTSAAYL